MNKLIIECFNYFKGSGFSFNICGGYALELFINDTIRKHSDLDICIFEEDKDDFIRYMHDKGWIIYEPLNDGLKRLISNPYEQKVEQICVFCIKPNCSFIKMHNTENEFYKMEILNTEQLNFDFIEVIFNPKTKDKLLYAQNHEITRELGKAVLYNKNDIPYMSPEIVLFCKSIYITREGYKKDFDMTVPLLSDESKTWLIYALEKSYPDGHEWLEALRR